MGETAVTCDGRMEDYSTDEWLQQKTLCRQQWTD